MVVRHDPAIYFHRYGYVYAAVLEDRQRVKLGFTGDCLRKRLRMVASQFKQVVTLVLYWKFFEPIWAQFFERTIQNDHDWCYTGEKELFCMPGVASQMPDAILALREQAETILISLGCERVQSGYDSPFGWNDMLGYERHDHSYWKATQPLPAFPSSLVARTRQIRLSTRAERGERLKALRADPAFNQHLQANRKKHGEIMKEKWATPEWRQKVVAAQRKAYKTRFRRSKGHNTDQLSLFE
jgi:hypothetical protein